MDLALGIIPLVTELVQSAYSLYTNVKLIRENRDTAKQLADKLREMEVALRNTECAGHAIQADVLADITRDFFHIRDCIAKTMREAEARCRISSLVDSPGIAQGLSESLQRTLFCRGRLENLQLFIAQNDHLESFVQKWQKLYEKFERFEHLLAHNSLLSEAMYSMNAATSYLLPQRRGQAGASSSTASPSDVDKTETLSINAFKDVPDAVRKLVQESSRKGFAHDSLEETVDNLFQLWDGWHIREDDLTYELNKRRKPVVLGRGGFGLVLAGHLMIRDRDGSSLQIAVAVKEIEISDDRRVQLAEVMREVLLQMAMRHHCILHSYGVCLPKYCGTVDQMRCVLAQTSNDSNDSQEALIVTERMACSLADAMHGNRLKSIEDKIKVVTDVATALSFLHSNNVIHRDVKPENVLLNFDKSNALVGYAKLSDFGCSRRVHINQTTMLLSTSGKATGTPLFMPPEALRNIYNSRTTKSWDVWSYGVLLCFVFAYEHRPKLLTVEAHMYAVDGSWGERIQQWASLIGDDTSRLIAKECLHVEADRRPPMTNLQSTTTTENMLLTAKQFYEGASQERNHHLAAELFERCAEAGNVDAMFYLGLCYINGNGVTKDPNRAVHFYRRAAEKGHLTAKTNLAVCYERGKGVEKNEQLAIKFFQEAAREGEPLAMTHLGSCYYHGTGVGRDEGIAVRLYQQATDRGDVRAMTYLGVCYEKGTGVQENASRAFNLYQKAASKGHPRAMMYLGECFERGMGVEKNEHRAFQLYQKAANGGQVEAMTCLGECFKNGVGVTKDESRAFELFRKAAEKDDQRAMTSLGVCYENGTAVKKDELQAFHLYERAANSGYLRAMTYLGMCYEHCKGVHKDQQRAVQLYQKAANKGHPRALANLGTCYEHGSGVEKDERRAAQLYRKAADKGDALAMTNLGSCYYNGTGVKKNEQRAVELYKKAARQGETFAMMNLGVCYENGTGVMKDVLRAVELYEKSAELGEPFAMINLGICYENGIGVDKDERKAFQFYERAAERGVPRACYYLALCFEHGIGIRKNKQRAQSLFQKAADRGYLQE